MKYLLSSLIILFSVLHLSDASAHRIIIGGGVVLGAPYYAYPPYYAYYPPYQPYPAYPPYPPYAYAPPPAYNYPPPPAPQDRYYESDNGDYCREYRHTVTIEGQRREAYGHACRQPDGSWRMVD